MNAKARKNFRQAVIGIAHEVVFDLSQAAARYVADANRPDLLDLAAIAHGALVEGVPLEIVGKGGPYATRAQRAAWAAGRLCAALYAIPRAYALVDERRAAASREAVLARRAEAYRIEAKAAWRAVPIDVPFREPKPNARLDWLLS
ncbi:hypothetical protein [Mesorhizobium sp. CN2-181]|uniref:hypothetical protein n=1 Tax=Mesorhizobium yinganensis TaxID=3157707 RepID=UPI0032B81BC2